MFRSKQTKFEPLNARKCQKRLKNLKKRNLARHFKHISIVFDSNHFNIITYAKILLCAMFRAKKTRFEPLYELSKSHKKPQKRNFARNINYMIIVFDSNHFSTITYTE